MSLWEFQEREVMYSHLVGAERKFQDASIHSEKARIAHKIRLQLSLTRKMRVLEIGSGTGLVSRELAPYVGTLDCCDISQSFLQVARAYTQDLTNISFHHIASGKFDFASDASYDRIFANNVFCHFNLYDIHAYLRECVRVLKPGGGLWFDIANSEAIAQKIPLKFQEMSQLYDSDRKALELLIQYNSPKAVLNLATQLGFSIHALYGEKHEAAIFILKKPISVADSETSPRAFQNWPRLWGHALGFSRRFACLAGLLKARLFRPNKAYARNAL